MQDLGLGAGFTPRWVELSPQPPPPVIGSVERSTCFADGIFLLLQGHGGHCGCSLSLRWKVVSVTGWEFGGTAAHPEQSAQLPFGSTARGGRSEHRTCQSAGREGWCFSAQTLGELLPTFRGEGEGGTNAHPPPALF